MKRLFINREFAIQREFHTFVTEMTLPATGSQKIIMTANKRIFRFISYPPEFLLHITAMAVKMQAVFSKFMYIFYRVVNNTKEKLLQQL